jgi:hypothetical protein
VKHRIMILRTTTDSEMIAIAIGAEADAASLG